MPHPFPAPDEIITRLRALALALRAAVLRGLATTAAEELASVAGERGGDVIYQLDERGETILLAFCERWGEQVPLRLVSEGLEGADDPDGALIFPAGSDPAASAFTLIVDPIDGTRGLMYNKRSAWALFGVAPTSPDG
ncbi:MAG: inositol monophosphatase, partial [Ktedonobacterales bacterium]